MDRVGVRELRQNLSVYLRRVTNGEALEVTEHGRPVAVLGPLTDIAPLAQLTAAGRLRGAAGNLAALGEPLPPTTITGTAALAEQRAGER